MDFIFYNIRMSTLLPMLELHKNDYFYHRQAIQGYYTTPIQPQRSIYNHRQPN